MTRRDRRIGDRVRLLALAAAACAGSSGVSAFEVDTGNPDLSFRWDNTIKYTAGWRVKGQSAALTTGAAPNYDDGNRNFDKGLISNRIDLLSEMDLVYARQYGLRLSGAASVVLQRDGRTLVFSGDIGRDDDLVMRAPQVPEFADTLVIESTYGDRRHAPLDEALAQLARVIRDTAARGGTVLIPSFAVGRAQSLLVALYRLREAGSIPELPVYLDSPMAIDATRLYRRFNGDHRLGDAECQAIYRGARFVNTPEESKRLAQLRVPSVLISASGMATGGRVLHHLKRLLPDPANHVVFAGFQAGGTRGAHLVSGAREVKIHGAWHPVNASVTQLDGFSAHADADELIGWMRQLHRVPRQVYVVHGEPEAADRLRHRIVEELGWPARVPEHGETVDVAL